MEKNKSILSNRIRSFRRSLDLTQQKFAEKLGVKSSTIMFVEQGRTKPSLELLLKISVTFKVSEQWLLTGKGKKYTGSASGIEI